MGVDKGKLLALAEAVEKLTRPDRETDARIAHAIKWRWDDWVEGDLCIESYTVEYVIDRVQNSHNSIWQHLPRFTASLDAAMTLVPDGKIFGCGSRDCSDLAWAWCGIEGQGDTMDDFAHGKTPALALCAAALRAQAEALA